ncbi:hypothetical protein AGMMS49992_19660 [Clostridia bacterium]|nr:hypothetical protein AGMMS49992_19660 [Clostridia bacterium]
MELVPAAVLGSSAAGIAFTIAHADTTALLDDGGLLASEFIAAMNVRPRRPDPNWCAETKSIWEECAQLGVVGDKGCIHASPITSMLAERLINHHADVRLFSRIIRIERKYSMWHITYCDAEGIHMLMAETVIDTRVKPVAQKRLSATLFADAKADGIIDPSGVKILPTLWDMEKILQIDLPWESDWIEARSALHGYWQQHRNRVFPGWRIASVASVFCYEYNSIVNDRPQDGYIRLISASYPSLFDAFDGGYICNIEQ